MSVLTDDRLDDMVAVAEQYCTFRVNDLTFGIDAQNIQEVLRHQPMTPVPQAPKGVTGLINLRGQIVIAIDLRARLGLPPGKPTGRPSMNVVVRSQEEVVSLLVDDIGEVINSAQAAPGQELEPIPSTLPESVACVLDGVLPLANTIMLVVAADRAADIELISRNND